jgi:hypothetical protein
MRGGNGNDSAPMPLPRGRSAAADYTRAVCSPSIEGWNTDGTVLKHAAWRNFEARASIGHQPAEPLRTLCRHEEMPISDTVRASGWLFGRGYGTLRPRRRGAPTRLYRASTYLAEEQEAPGVEPQGTLRVSSVARKTTSISYPGHPLPWVAHLGSPPPVSPCSCGHRGWQAEKFIAMTRPCRGAEYLSI